MPDIVWTLLLTACFSDTSCINQRVDMFETKEQCVMSRIMHEELPTDGSWKTIEFICKPLGSIGA